MWELDYKESWVLKNWCFWTVVLKTFESPLDCKEIQPVHPKGDQSWVFTGRTDAEAETPILWPPDAKSWLIGKDPDAGRDWGQEEKGTTEDKVAGWHHRPNGHGFGWTLGVGDGQGGLVCCSSWGHKELDMTEWLNWTDAYAYTCIHIHKHVCAQSFSHVQLFATPWTIAVRLLCPQEFSRQEYWSSLPCPPPGDIPNLGIEPRTPTLQADSLPSEPPGKPIHTHTHTYTHIYRLTHISTCTHTNTYIQRKKIIPKIQCPLKKKDQISQFMFSAILSMHASTTWARHTMFLLLEKYPWVPFQIPVLQRPVTF